MWMGWCRGDDPDEKLIIMELVSGRNVSNILYPPAFTQKGSGLRSTVLPKPSKPPSLKRRMEIARDVALGMIELHSLNPPIL